MATCPKCGHEFSEALKVATCNRCGKSIYWVTTKAGKKMPIEASSWDGSPMFKYGVHISHFDSCGKGSAIPSPNQENKDYSSVAPEKDDVPF